jgi:hypothetical protein
MKSNLSVAGFDTTLAPAPSGGPVVLEERFSVDVRALQEGRAEGFIKRLPDVVVGSQVFPRFHVRCVGQHCGIVNKNRRFYPAESTWRAQTMVETPFMRKIGARRVTGQLEHPPDGRGAMPLGAIVITKVEPPLPDGRVFIEFETLSTDHGLIVAHYILDGVGFGMSSRGRGSVIRNAEGVDVVQPDFEADSFDCVLDESTPGAEVTATMTKLRESLREALRVSRVSLIEAAGGDVEAAAALARKRTEEAVARDCSSGVCVPVAQAPAKPATTCCTSGKTEAAPASDIAQIAAAAASAAVAAAAARKSPPLGPSEYLLAVPGGEGHYRAHMNGKNQWDVWLHVHNLPPEEIAANLPTVQNSKQAAENHLRLIVGEAVERGFLTVSGPVGSGVYKALRQRRRRGGDPMRMREAYEIKSVMPYTGTMLELTCTTDEECKKVASALEKAGFHVEQDAHCCYVHTAITDGHQALAHVSRVLGRKDIEMRESARLASVAKGKVVYVEPATDEPADEGINTLVGDPEPAGTFPEADFDIDDMLPHGHDEPDGDEGPHINLIVIDAEDLADLLAGGETDEADDEDEPGEDDPQANRDAATQSDRDAQDEDGEGGGPAAGPATGPDASGYPSMDSPVLMVIPGGGEYEALRARHASEMMACPYEGYAEMVRRHHAEMKAMSGRRMRHENTNVSEAGSGYGTPNPLDDPEDLDLDLDWVKEPKVDLNYESAKKRAEKLAAEAKKAAAVAEAIKAGKNPAALPEIPEGAASTAQMPRPKGADGKAQGGKVMLWFDAKDQFIEAREFDEKGVLVRRVRPNQGDKAKLETTAAAPATEETRKAQVKETAKAVMAALAPKPAAAPATAPAPATPAVAETAPAAPASTPAAPTAPAAPAATAPATPAAPAPVATEAVDELKKKNRHLQDEVARLESRVKDLEKLVDTMAEVQQTQNVKAKVNEAIAKHPELERIRGRLEKCAKPDDVVAEASAFVKDFKLVNEARNGAGTPAAPPKDGKIIPLPTAATAPAPAPTAPPATRAESTAQAPSAPKTASASSANTPDAPTGPVADEAGADFLGEGLRVSSTVDESDTSRRVADARRRRQEQLNGNRK